MTSQENDEPQSPTSIMATMDVDIAPVLPDKKVNKRNIRYILENKRINKILRNMSDKKAADEIQKAIYANMPFSTIRKNLKLNDESKKALDDIEDNKNSKVKYIPLESWQDGQTITRNEKIDPSEMIQEDVFMVCYVKRKSLFKSEVIQANIVSRPEKCDEEIWVYPREELCKRVMLTRKHRMSFIGMGWKKVESVPFHGEEIKMGTLVDIIPDFEKKYLIREKYVNTANPVAGAAGAAGAPSPADSAQTVGFRLEENDYKNIEMRSRTLFTYKSYIKYKNSIFIPVDVQKVNEKVKSRVIPCPMDATYDINTGRWYNSLSSSTTEVRQGLPVEISLELYDAFMQDCEKDIILHQQDAITGLIARHFKNFLIHGENTLTTVVDACEPYTPRLVKVIGKKIVKISQCALSYLWNHPYVCILISSMSRILRLALCLIPHMQDTELLYILGLKILKSFLISTLGEAYTKASLAWTILKNLWAVVTCSAQQIKDSMKYGLLGAFKVAFGIIKECAFKMLDLSFFGKLGEEIKNTIFNFGSYVADTSGINELFGKLAALSPFELANITSQIKSVTDMIRKPVTYITGHYLMKIFLHNPMYFIAAISRGNIAIMATIKGGEEALKRIIGRRTFKNIQDVYEFFVETFANNAGFVSAAIEFMDAMQQIMETLVCAIKIAYAKQYGTPKLSEKADDEEEGGLKGFIMDPLGWADKKSDEEKFLESDESVTSCCPETQALINFLVGYNHETAVKNNRNIIENYQKHTGEALKTVWANSPWISGKNDDEGWITMFQDKWYGNEKEYSIADRFVKFITTEDNQVGNFINLTGSGMKDGMNNS